MPTPSRQAYQTHPRLLVAWQAWRLPALSLVTVTTTPGLGLVSWTSALCLRVTSVQPRFTAFMSVRELCTMLRFWWTQPLVALRAPRLFAPQKGVRVLQLGNPSYPDDLH